MDRLLKRDLIPSVTQWITTVFNKLYVPRDISKYFSKQITMKKKSMIKIVWKSWCWYFLGFRSVDR